MPSAEHTFLEEGRIAVTNARFVVGSKTYPIANISSVTRGRDRSAKDVAIGLAVVLLCALVLCIVSGLVYQIQLAFWTVLALFALSTFAGFNVPVQHIVLIRTAGVEAKALSSPDSLLVDRIIKALNDAIIARG